MPEKERPWNALENMPVRVSPPARRPENLYGRRCIMFAKVTRGRAPRNRRSQSAFQRHGAHGGEAGASRQRKSHSRYQKAGWARLSQRSGPLPSQTIPQTFPRHKHGSEEGKPQRGFTKGVIEASAGCRSSAWFSRPPPRGHRSGSHQGKERAQSGDP
jgi:hypothetical protein